MKNDAKAVDRWNDDGGASYKSALQAYKDRRTQEVRIKFADHPEITTKIRGGWRYRRVPLKQRVAGHH